MRTLVREGSSKNVYLENGELIFFYKNDVSIFDIGPLGKKFPKLGRLRGAFSNKIFKDLNQAGFETAFIRSGRLHRTAIMAPLDVPEKSITFERAIGRLLPLEILFRFSITPKFFGRIVEGKVNRGKVEALLAPGETLRVGARLRRPYMECTTKLQAADVYLNDSAAAKLAGLSLGQLEEIYAKDVEPLAMFLRQYFKSFGFSLLDGKFEGGLTHDGRFILSDSVSPDELRLVGNDGKQHDKDPVRFWYEKTYPDWFKSLKAAKESFPNDKSRWPTYPGPPDPEVVAETIKLYQVAAETIGAI